MNITKLDDSQIIYKVTSLADQQRKSISSLIKYLYELDRRGLHLALGYSGLFSFLIGKLLFCESSAWRYCQAVKVVGLFPVILEDIASGQLSLTNVATAAKRLLDQKDDLTKRRELLFSLRNKSKAQVDSLIAETKICVPREKVNTLILELPQPKETSKQVSDKVDSSVTNGDLSEDNNKEIPNSTTPTPYNDLNNQKQESHQVVMKKLSITIDLQTYEKLQRAKELLSGKYPKGATIADVLDQTLELFLEKKCPKKIEERKAVKAKAVVVKDVHKTQKNVAQKDSSKKDRVIQTPETVVIDFAQANNQAVKRKYLPVSLRQQVLKRCDYKCSFVGADGKRCQSKHNLAGQPNWTA